MQAAVIKRSERDFIILASGASTMVRLPSMTAADLFFRELRQQVRSSLSRQILPANFSHDLRKQLQEPKRRPDFRLARMIARILVVGSPRRLPISGFPHSSRATEVLPNVQDEPRPWLARLVLLGARDVTAMVVGSGALLGFVWWPERDTIDDAGERARTTDFIIA